ncbi:hypothetical protein QA584_11915 [Anaerocolumna sp. AGMB13025]|uniref:hypothetical protein n=1 Tax=Anaerocolumna sp. AGMB13025 TaxID=3039116 RepID=UPI00241E0163|nr:hypothetical protein [Anaerocolumna sp. AGMB13025]WFR59755.1 hypothetical protein QA584_11915 [Anaerocolumna sp. AGMB13025]
MDIDETFKDSAPKQNIFSHILDIVRAAFPYLDSDTQQSAQIIVKTGELMDAYNSIRHKDSITTFSMRTQNIDIEALLTNVRTVCTDKERELIDTILNLIKAKNLYDTYTAFASMASQSVNTENPDGSTENSNSGSSSPDMMDILGAFLTPEQKSTFENINMMFNMTQDPPNNE